MKKLQQDTLNYGTYGERSWKTGCTDPSMLGQDLFITNSSQCNTVGFIKNKIKQKIIAN